MEGSADAVARAERVFAQLAGLLREGYRFSRGDVKTAAQLLADAPDAELQEYFRPASGRTAGRRQVTPKSVTQRRYLDAIDRFDVVFGVGPAGTGKTPSPICFRSA